MFESVSDKLPFILNLKLGAGLFLHSVCCIDGVLSGMDELDGVLIQTSFRLTCKSLTDVLKNHSCICCLRLDTRANISLRMLFMFKQHVQANQWRNSFSIYHLCMMFLAISFARPPGFMPIDCVKQLNSIRFLFLFFIQMKGVPKYTNKHSNAEFYSWD